MPAMWVIWPRRIDTNTTLKETGVLLDLSLMKDGKNGFATTVSSVTQSTTVWRFGEE